MKNAINTARRHLEGPYGESINELPKSPIYLYLTKVEWAEPWTNGGKIPMNPARAHPMGIESLGGFPFFA
jgi:hypothetical protein